MIYSEALKIARMMKEGMSFFGDDPAGNRMWFFSYERDAGVYRHHVMDTLVGATLCSSDYREDEAVRMIASSYHYGDLMKHSVTADGADPGEGWGVKDAAAGDEYTWDQIRGGIDIPHASFTDIRVRNFCQSLCRERNRGLLHAWLAAGGKPGGELLHMACRHGFLEGVKILMKAGATITGPGDGACALFSACDGECDNHELVRFLVDAGSDVRRAPAGCDTPLGNAAMRGHIQSVKVLLEAGGDANGMGGFYTPLQHAAVNNRVQVLELLIEHGAEVNVLTASGDNALVETVTAGDYTDTARVLIDAGTDVNHAGKFGKFPLKWAAAMGRTGIVRLLVQAGALVDLRVSSNTFRAEATSTPLGDACINGHWEIAGILLDAGADPNIPDGFGLSPLQRAAAAGSVEVVKKLLKRGARAGYRADFAGTALTDAASSGNMVILKAIHRAGGDINGADGFSGESALHRAAYHGHLPAARYLLEQGASIEAQDSRGNTPLHHAAWGGHKGLVKLLIQKGARIKALDSLNWNALMQACDRGHYDTAKMLLPYFLDDLGRAGTEEGETPLVIARKSGNSRLVKLLLDTGARNNKKGR